MSTFSVDPAAVLDMASRLIGLRDEFEGADSTVEGYDDALGFEPLTEALHAFATNWSDEKRKVGELIGEVAGAAQSAGEAYRACDGELAAGFDQDGAPGGAGA